MVDHNNPGGPPQTIRAALAGTALEIQAASQSDNKTYTDAPNFIQLGTAVNAALAELATALSTPVQGGRA